MPCGHPIRLPVLHYWADYIFRSLRHSRLFCIIIRIASSEIWYLSTMRAAKVQASLRIRAVSPEPPLLAHTSSESRGTFRQKARSLAPLNGWTCAVKICHDGMLEDTNSLDGAHTVALNDLLEDENGVALTAVPINRAWYILWATSWENLFLPYANNKAADQPAHARSLISAFVVRYHFNDLVVSIKKSFSVGVWTDSNPRSASLWQSVSV